MNINLPLRSINQALGIRLKKFQSVPEYHLLGIIKSPFMTVEYLVSECNKGRDSI